MSVQRNYERYLLAKQGISKRRGIRHQFGRHIIKRGVTAYRTITKCNITRHIPGNGPIPTELHATKGWRTVEAWS